jgi:hypothetical protein
MVTSIFHEKTPLTDCQMEEKVGKSWGGNKKPASGRKASFAVMDE